VTDSSEPQAPKPKSNLTAEELNCIYAFVAEYKGSLVLQKAAVDSPFPLKEWMGLMAATRCSGLGSKKY
jgi:hypothetical protein